MYFSSGTLGSFHCAAPSYSPDNSMMRLLHTATAKITQTFWPSKPDQAEML